jgi:hypothetical protein
MSGERFTGLPGKPAGGTPQLSDRLGGGVTPTRVALLGCGVLLFLLGVAAIIFLLKADDFVGWVFGSVEETVVERLPADLPAAERQRLDRAFAAAAARLESGDAEPDTLRPLQADLTRLVRAGDDSPLSRDEVAEITATLERIGGIAEDPDAPPVAVSGARGGEDSDRP